MTVLDNFIRGVPEWLTALEGNRNLTLATHDITKALPDTIGDHEYLIHGASIASPIYYRKYPIETMDANVNGLRHLLDYCLRQQQAGKTIEGILFYSSSEIYGDPTPENIPTRRRTAATCRAPDRAPATTSRSGMAKRCA